MPNQSEWDIRFLKLAREVASWSKDPSTKVGAVIVRPDRTVCSVGYNGFPRKMSDSKGRLLDREDKYSRTIHSELNAILSAKENLNSCSIYIWPCLSCRNCALHIIQSGIRFVIYKQSSTDILSRWGEEFIEVKEYYNECGVVCKEYEID